MVTLSRQMIGAYLGYFSLCYQMCLNDKWWLKIKEEIKYSIIRSINVNETGWSSSKHFFCHGNRVSVLNLCQPSANR